MKFLINEKLHQSTGLFPFFVQLKGHGTCGASTFKAGKSDSSSQYRGLDETGIVCMCCRHGVILRAANMYPGETYRIICFLQMYVYKLNIIFFCYDVICRYQPFAKKLGIKNFLYAVLTTKMKRFLSRFHGNAHEWICQVHSYNDRNISDLEV